MFIYSAVILLYGLCITRFIQQGLIYRVVYLSRGYLSRNLFITRFICHAVYLASWFIYRPVYFRAVYLARGLFTARLFYCTVRLSRGLFVVRFR